MMNFSRFKAIVLMSVGSTVLSVLLHNLATYISQEDLFKTGLPASEIQQAGLFIPMIIVLLMVTFITLGLIFAWFQERLPGSGIQKGLAFFMPIGLLWVIGFQENQIMVSSTWFPQLLHGFSDCIPLTLMGWLMGKYIAQNNQQECVPFKPVPALLVITCVITAGRYIAYHIFHIQDFYSVSNAYLSQPLFTFFWTVSLGAGAGLFYVLIGQKLSARSSIERSLIFGGVMFGMQGLLFYTFLPLFVKFSVVKVNMLFVPLWDSLCMILSMYLLAGLRQFSESSAFNQGTASK
jgi:hypothetical protein